MLQQLQISPLFMSTTDPYFYLLIEHVMSTYYLPDIVANTWNELQVINNVRLCPQGKLIDYLVIRTH